MAVDEKITALTEITSASSEDLLVIVDDPGGTPATRKIQVGNVLLGLYGSRGQTSNNNTTTPNTQFDLQASRVQLWNPTSNGIAVRDGSSVITNNISTSGPVANGRDQVAAFTASSFIHFYWIWNGTTLASVSSATAPPTGPTLPATYTHWSYAGAARLNSSGNIVACRFIGNTFTYDEKVNALTNGNNSTESAVSLSAIVPPNAQQIMLQSHARFSDSAVTTNQLHLRVVTLKTYVAQIIETPITAGDGNVAFPIIPNVGQSFIYIWSVATAVRQATIDVLGFTMPNGGI